MTKYYHPEGYSLEIFRNRYSFTPQETWLECCTRTSRQMALAELPDKQKAYEEKFFEILATNLFVPGGRILYNSGRNKPQLLNCFPGNVRFLTKTGIKNFKESVNERVQIRNKYGNWEWATIKEFGEQSIYKMILENGYEIETTEGHEWVQKDGTKKTTLETKEVLFGESSPIETDPDGIRHGLIFGDGHVVGEFSQLVLCGDKKQELCKYFKNESRESIGYNNAVRTYWTVTKQSTGMVVHRQPKHYKEIPINITPEYARGFIAGLIATDGCVPQKGSIIINCEGLELAHKISEIANLGGCIVTSIHVNSKISPFDGSPRELATILIKPFTAPIIRQDQLERMNLRKCKKIKMSVKVKSAVNTFNKEKVYCAVTDETATFTLANGILTGNCFVMDPNKDSKEGWGNSARNMIITSMTGGGCGDDFSDVRPKGAMISGQKGTCPGPVELMKLINGCASPVRAGGERRVALMFSLDLDHPDIEDFLDAKLTQGELSFANISVRSRRTKEFIKAVKNDLDWDLSWKGKYKKTIKAKILWDKIVKNSYNSAEPGFLNYELALNESTIYYIHDLVTTNPCGEIFLPAYGSCCLGSLVLPRFFINNEVDYHLLGNTIRTAVRFLDNVLSVNEYPLPDMQLISHNTRRIGLGTTGLADLLALAGYKYGSEEGNKFIDKLFRFISKAAYEASIMLAIEKGPFPLCNPEKHIESGFVSRMPSKIKSLIKEHGIRNCALLTQAPTGTVSILSNNCSSGIEPMFAPAYERRYWVENERKKELIFHPLFAQFMDDGRDVSHFVGVKDLTIKEHLEVQKTVQKHIDNAVSKTINLPNNYPMEEMSDLWLDYLPYLKGTTFYREGTRGFVDDKGNIKEPPLVAIDLDASQKLYDSKYKKEVAYVDDCPNGICEVPNDRIKK